MMFIKIHIKKDSQPYDVINCWPCIFLPHSGFVSLVEAGGERMMKKCGGGEARSVPVKL